MSAVHLVLPGSLVSIAAIATYPHSSQFIVSMTISRLVRLLRGLGTMPNFVLSLRALHDIWMGVQLRQVNV